MLEKYEGDPIGEIEKYEARGKQLEKKLVNPEKRESVSKRGGNGCFRMHALRFSQKNGEDINFSPPISAFLPQIVNHDNQAIAAAE